MAGYLILDSERLDEDAYAEFIERVAESAEAHGGRYLARGGATEVLEGDWTPHRVVVNMTYETNVVMGVMDESWDIGRQLIIDRE